MNDYSSSNMTNSYILNKNRRNIAGPTGPTGPTVIVINIYR